MRIGFITQEYPPEFGGGAGTYAKHLVEGLADLGHEVVVFAPLTAGKHGLFLQRARIKTVPIIIPRTPLSMAFYWLKLRRAVKKEEIIRNFDIIHINAPTHWVPGNKRITKTPQVLTIHHLSRDLTYVGGPGIEWGTLSLGGENNLIVKLFESCCVHTSDAIIAVSDFTKGRLEERYASEAKNIVTIYEAPETPSPCNSSTVEILRKKLGLGSEKILLFVGRLNDPRKGLDLLLTALSMNPDFSDYVLLIVGKGDPVPVKKMAESFGLLDRMRILGFVEASDLWNLYCLCDLYVVPSRLEGFGLTVLDAASAGKKVVATRVGAIPEIGGPGTILVEPNNPEAFANGINLAFSEEGPLPEVIREHASHFNWSDVARSTEKLYNDVRIIHRQQNKPK